MRMNTYRDSHAESHVERFVLEQIKKTSIRILKNHIIPILNIAFFTSSFLVFKLLNLINTIYLVQKEFAQIIVLKSPNNFLPLLAS